MNVPHMIKSFKWTNSNGDKEAFNICVAKCRVTNEHCIGVLKSHWHSLKEIRSQFKNKADCEWMVRWINMCVRLHNYVMEMNDPWIDEDQTIVLDVEVGLTTTRPALVHTMAALRLQAATGRLLLKIVMERALAFNRQFGQFLWDLLQRSLYYDQVSVPF